MDGRESEARERAQLWALYFGMRALRRSPAFLREAESELRRLLESGDVPTLASVGLRLVK
jgi:hypothetical protein